MELSRRQRAAASTVAMIVVTIFAYIPYHFGHRLEALGMIALSGTGYAIWVSLGRDESSDNEEERQ